MQKAVVSSLLLLFCSFSISHGHYYERISKADMTGVWSTDKSFVWLYKNRKMKLLNQNCFLKALGNWRYDGGSLHIYVNGKRIFWPQVMELPKNWYIGYHLRLLTTAHGCYTEGIRAKNAIKGN